MIFNMYRWQREVGRLARSLQKQASQQRWLESSDALLEKNVMLGFYAIRKMLPQHAFQPPPYLAPPPQLKLTTFPSSKAKRSPIFWPDVAEAFDLSAPQSQMHDLEHVCNQVIHSFFFSTWLSPSHELRGIFFCSDRFKNREIYQLELSAIVGLFTAVAASRDQLGSLCHFVPDNNRIVL